MKFKTFLSSHQPLVKDVIISTCLIGASAGVVFGISAAKFKVEYMNLDGGQTRLAASASAGYYSQAITSRWNMNAGMQDGKEIPALQAPKWPDMKAALAEQSTASAAKEWWENAHPECNITKDALWNDYDKLGMSTESGKILTSDQIWARYNYSSMVIDGSTHTTLDRSFNQSLYNGLVDFVKNQKIDRIDPETGKDPTKGNIAKSYKPSQDNTTDFINTYTSVIENHRVVGLAGFNHSTPLAAMMSHKQLTGGTLDPLASNPNDKINKETNRTGFILLDADAPNNQNVASVQFRSDQPGFLSALSTCQYFYNNLHMYHNKHQNISVAEFGGVQIPTVMIYMGGFQRGIEFFNYFVLNNTLNFGAKYWLTYATAEDFKETEPDEYALYSQDYNEFENLVNYAIDKDAIVELKKSTDKTTEEKIVEFAKTYQKAMYDEYSIKMIKLGDIGTHFSGTFNAGDAIGITKQYLNRGASAIIAVAGPQSLDSAQEIRNQNSKCIVIGVDSSMEDGDYQRYHNGSNESTKTSPNTKDPYMDKTVSLDGSVSQQANAIIKFSAVKDIRSVSEKITRLCAEGKNWDVSDETGEAPDPDKAVCGPGFQTCGNIKNGLISVSWDGFPMLINALSHVPFVYGDAKGFVDLWSKLVDAYKEMLGKYDKAEVERLTEVGYWDAVIKPEQLTSFKREKDGKPTVLFSNFNHTIGILGRLFELAKLTFQPNMTLIESQDKPGEYVVPTEPVDLSIDEWLNNNMYLMC